MTSLPVTSLKENRKPTAACFSSLNWMRNLDQMKEGTKVTAGKIAIINVKYYFSSLLVISFIN